MGSNILDISTVLTFLSLIVPIIAIYLQHKLNKQQISGPNGVLFRSLLECSESLDHWSSDLASRNVYAFADQSIYDLQYTLSKLKNTLYSFSKYRVKIPTKYVKTCYLSVKNINRLLIEYDPGRSKLFKFFLNINTNSVNMPNHPIAYLKTIKHQTCILNKILRERHYLDLSLIVSSIFLIIFAMLTIYAMWQDLVVNGEYFYPFVVLSCILLFFVLFPLLLFPSGGMIVEKSFDETKWWSTKFKQFVNNIKIFYNDARQNGPQ